MWKIDGGQIAQRIIDNLKNQPTPKKILAAVLAGENQASISFLKQKEKIAQELGVDFRIYRFSTEIKNDDLRKEVLKIALLKKVGGMIVQLPLPEHINKHYILNVIPREKDVDVLGERALGAFYCGRNPVLPPAVATLDEILQTINCGLQTKKIAVVGAGFLIGKPIAVWLMDNKIKELKIFEKGSDLLELKEYDLVISGVGQVGLIKPEMLKDGAGIIDFGYSMDENGKIRGDFDVSQMSHAYRQAGDVKGQLSFYTPTPGGTGPILVAKLFENFYNLNKDEKLIK
ncbi:MAG: bifunctional 5,10-methylenetetrahydrofolate dehydrogenase/5,10-methenyltetrahydrofolate cyclohydrolase [Patescibacteria group bacterium]|mgnify:FL=1